MARLFIAIDLPPDRSAALATLRNEELGARWTPVEQLHITLRFLGDVDETEVEPLRERLRGVASPSFRVSGEQLDTFPSRRRPRVLVARVSSDSNLIRLREEIERVVIELGFEMETRPFQPHVTLARFKRAAPRKVRQFIKDHSTRSIEPFIVSQFHLYRSDLKPSGAEHTVVESYDLDEAP